MLMPPSGSVTPITTMEPQPTTVSRVVIQAPVRHDGSPKRFSPGTFASMSPIMKRATPVPASMVVRMNSASNITAKWYQKALAAPISGISTKIWAMPKASVGAPPVREMMVVSPTSWAA